MNKKELLRKIREYEKAMFAWQKETIQEYEKNILNGFNFKNEYGDIDLDDEYKDMRRPSFPLDDSDEIQYYLKLCEGQKYYSSWVYSHDFNLYHAACEHLGIEPLF